jgi:eukaryotic-like serine/threonine-protein kinase
MILCPQCGASTSAADRFCGDCGAGLPPRAAPSGGMGAAQVEPVRVAAAAAGAGEASSTAHAESTPVREDEPTDADVIEMNAEGDAPIAPNDAPLVDAGQEAQAATPAEAPRVVETGEGIVSDEARATDGVKASGAASAPATDGVPAAAPAPTPGTVRSGSTGRLRQPAKQLDPGTMLYSRYEIVRRIGGGGMGAVYLAKDRNLGDQPRAVKEMIQSQLDETQHEKAINDFRRESMLLASLEHASIPTIYDYFYDEAAGRFYLVMKYISGGDLLARLRNAHGGRLDERTIADWGAQIADVLDYLHRRNPPIIYRDLKPANLMIDGNSGRIMLIDFGIARWVAPQQEKGVTAVGTMGYAPPELFSGKVVPASDIYSLGATMFHLLTGSDPQDNPLLIFDFTKNPRPRQLAPALSNELEAILMRAVEYKPENRFRTAAELRDALIAHLQRLNAGQVSYGSPSEPASAKTIQTEMVFCGFCGGRIAADDLYCAHCGQRQPLAVASAALRSARATAKLVVMGTTELDSSFQLHKESSLVGRTDPNSNIFPEVDLSRFDPHTKVSRRHARIFRKGDVYLVEDLGSINGTVINDSLRLAPHQPRALESGDKLRLGETTLHFLIG